MVVQTVSVTDITYYLPVPCLNFSLMADSDVCLVHITGVGGLVHCGVDESQCRTHHFEEELAA